MIFGEEWSVKSAKSAKFLRVYRKQEKQETTQKFSFPYTPKNLTDLTDLADHAETPAREVCQVISGLDRPWKDLTDFLSFVKTWFLGTARDLSHLMMREFFWCRGDLREGRVRAREPWALEGLDTLFTKNIKKINDVNVLMGVGFWLATDTLEAPSDEEAELMRYDRLFYDFDLEGEPEKAREEALSFAESLRKAYGVIPVVVDSGLKGAHVYAFLTTPIKWGEYKALWEHLLVKHCSKEGLVDRNVLQHNRLARVPYTYNIKEGKKALARIIYPKEMGVRDFRIEGLTPLDINKVKVYTLVGVELPQTVEVVEGMPDTAVFRPGDPVLLKNLDAVPPCVKSWISELVGTGELNHYARFNLVLFMKWVGYGVEDCVNLFGRYARDFREEVTRYYVEHAFGLRGSRKDYSMYSCAKLRELGLCQGCGWDRNPVTYFFKRVKQERKPQESPLA
jgi:hypothetical protein